MIECDWFTIDYERIYSSLERLKDLFTLLVPNKHIGLTIIAKSLPILSLLAGLPQISVIVMGGRLRYSELSFIVHITEQAFNEIKVDRVIIGIRAISMENGLPTITRLKPWLLHPYYLWKNAETDDGW